MTPARAALLASAVVLSTTPASPAQEPPAFPAQASVVTVDVVVVDREGRPVPGLAAADFTVLQDGRPQPIVAFEARDLDADSRRAEARPREEAKETDEPARRRLAFVVDDLFLEDVTPAVEALRRWLRERARPGDEVVLATTSGRVSAEGDAVASRAELLHALELVRPRAKLRNPAAERDRQGTILATIGGFAGDPAERARQSIYVFSPGFPRGEEAPRAASSSAPPQWNEEAIDAAQRANTAVYFVDARGLVAGAMDLGRELEREPVRGILTAPPATASTPRPPVDVRAIAHRADSAGAEHLALQTGGALVRDTNDVAGAFERVADESARYYLLGYERRETPDDRWHELEVKCARPGLTVRARRSFFASSRPLGDRRTRSAGPAGSTPAPGTPAPEPVPTFPALAEAVTVDVLVLDPAGRPVDDLERADFTVLEEGRAQEVVGFDRRTLPPAGDEPEPVTDGVATNVPRRPEGRTLLLVVDDLGIEPLQMPAVADAVGRWLASSADPRDQVTIATSSGDAWWSDRVGQGREDLEAVLGRIEGRRHPSSARDALSDWEAYAIDVLGLEAGPVPGFGGGATGGACRTGSPPSIVLDRVVDRWLASGHCPCSPLGASSIASCRIEARARAREVYRAATTRATLLLRAVERVSRGLVAVRGRKSVVVLSAGLLGDTDRRAFEAAVDASRRANTSVSFVDVRGLISGPSYGAEHGAPPDPRGLALVAAEATVGEIAGGDELARSTGGEIVSGTNDVSGAVARLVDEGSTHYLLAYQPDRGFDGRWRRLRVAVARPGVKVKARRGYFARDAAPEASAPREERGKARPGKGEPPEGDPGLVGRADPALSAGGERDGVPLRMKTHAFETGDDGRVRLLVALEVDTAALTFSRGTARLDVTVVGVGRDAPVVAPVDSGIEIGEPATRGWWVFSRELRLPPGVAQVRALVRDTASGHGGMVAERVLVPRLDAAYLSTPVLTDLVGQVSGRTRVMPVARRRFRVSADLYCAFEVLRAPAGDFGPFPQFHSRYSIWDDSGRQVAWVPETMIGVGLGGHVSRIYGIPLRGLPPGRYRLEVEATDRRSGAILRAGDAFTIEEP